MRALGKGPGIAVLLIDALKGSCPVWLAPRRVSAMCDPSHALQIICCVFVIAGHNWTCWLKFKGGKGVATSAGALLAFLPLPLLCALGVWLIVFGIWRYVSLASICAAVALPIATWFLQKDPTLFVFTVVDCGRRDLQTQIEYPTLVGGNGEPDWQAETRKRRRRGGMNVTVIGTGGWGTALAVLLHGNGHKVALWGRLPEEVDPITGGG